METNFSSPVKFGKPQVKKSLLSYSVPALLALSVPFFSTQVFAQAVAQLEEVVVTARKVEENLQETPVAITALTEEGLERRMITSTTDLGRVTPNLQFTSYSPLSGNNSAAQVFIRGIGQSDSSGGVDPGVGLYIDDVYMGRSVGGAMDFKDISNVQVLRGPQGTLFGRNTIGGAVLLSTKKPGDELGGNIKVGIGADNMQEFFGGIDIPISENVAARVSVGTRERDGYVTRIYDDIDLGNENTTTVNGSLHFDVSDDVSLVFRADYTEEKENGSPFVFAAVNENGVFPAVASVDAGCPGASFPPPSVPAGVVDFNCANNATYQLGPYTNGGNSKAESNMQNSGYSITANVDLTDMWSMKYIYADRSLEWDGSRDADNTYLTILSTQYDSEADQTSHEVQLLASGDDYHGVIGFFYFEEEINDFLLVPFAAPPVVLAPGRVVALDNQDATLNNDNFAVFTQWTYDVTDNLSITAGLRHTDEDKTIQIYAFGVPTGVALIDDGNGIFVPADDPIPTPDIPTAVKTDADAGSTAPGALNIDPQPFSESFRASTGSLSVQYNFSDRWMGYGSWSQGFKSGGFNQRYNAAPGGNTDPNNGPEPIAFASEKAETFEIGFKADITDNFRLNGALFDTTYENMQLTYRVGIVPLLFNAGESSISGAELEFTYVPSEAFILEGNLGYMSDDIKEVADIPGATATLGPENSLPFTPELQMGLSTGYIFDLGSLTLTPRINVSYTEEQFFDAANSVDVAQQDAETVTNLSFQIADHDDVWNITMGVDNLTDEQYPIAGNSSYGTSSGYAEVIYSRPRSYYLNLRYNF